MDKRVKKTRAAIEKAYFEILAEKGNKITVSEIARVANIDRKTFYLHYESVDDILKYFCKKQVVECIAEFKISEKTSSFDIVSLFDLLNKIIAKNIELLQVISESSGRAYFFEQLRRHMIKAVTSDYRRYFIFSDLELHVYAEFYISGIIASYSRWFDNKLPVTTTDLAKMLNDAAANGLVSLMQEKVSSK